MEVGQTHDIIVHVSDSLAVGLALRPFTYRVSHLPTFLPRMTAGDPSGADYSNWRSFVQRSFFQGSGQYYWSNPHGNSGFAESSLFDIGMEFNVAQGVIARNDPSWAFGENLSPTASAQVARIPKFTNSKSWSSLNTLFSGSYKSWMFLHSNHPHVVHNYSTVMYTNLEGANVWKDGSGAYSPFGLTGYWRVQHTTWGAPVVSAVRFSNTFIVARNDGEMRAFGESLYTPAYNTSADHLAVYDSKLWRMHKNKTAYLRAVAGTTALTWSEYYDINDNPETFVNNAAVFAGRLYFGSQAGLSVFDAGRIYDVQDYGQHRDSENFNLLMAHQGALYYNVRAQLFRLTGGGLIEKIRTPMVEGYIFSGCVDGDDVIYATMELGKSYARTWVFNPESGGVRQWFDTKQFYPFRLGHPTDTGIRPNSLLALQGHVFFMPAAHSQFYGASTTRMPIIATNRRRFGKNEPDYPDSYGVYQTGGEASLVTSLFDFGLPTLDKEFNRIVVEHNMPEGEQVEVFMGTRLAVDHQASQYIPGVVGASAGFEPISLTTWGMQDTEEDYNTPVPKEFTVPGAYALTIYSVYDSLANVEAQFADFGASGYITQIKYMDSSYSEQTLDPSNYSFDNSDLLTIDFRPIMDDFGRYNMVPIELGGEPESHFSITFGGSSAEATHEEHYYTYNHSYAAGESTPAVYTPGHRYIVSDWDSLGHLTGTGQVRRDELSMDYKRSKEVLFKFAYYDSHEYPIQLRSFEIEYMPVGRQYRRIDAVITGVEAILRPDLQIENSLALMQATLFSITESQLAYTVQLPFPAPTAHTMNARIRISPPGATAPLMSYTDMHGEPRTAMDFEAGITIEEV